MAHLDQSVDVALRASELCRVLHVDEHNKVEVVPHVVLTLHVLLKACALVVKARPLQACNERELNTRMFSTMLCLRDVFHGTK